MIGEFAEKILARLKRRDTSVFMLLIIFLIFCDLEIIKE